MFARIPVLMLISARGEVGETEYWAVQHRMLMEPFLNAFGFPYKYLRSAEPGEIKKALIGAVKTMNMQVYPAALIVGGELT